MARAANAFASADPASRALSPCAVELCSLHYYYGSAADKLVANAIFADGAVVVVGSRSTHYLAAVGSCLISVRRHTGCHGW